MILIKDDALYLALQANASALSAFNAAKTVAIASTGNLSSSSNAERNALFGVVGDSAYTTPSSYITALLGFNSLLAALQASVPNKSAFLHLYGVDVSGALTLAQQ